ncbi:AI-2E family transporter [Patescibacteria group bacterium]|nr:AI-2E family transporter [Patescibacteria group bacterium]MBU1908373.1 AI-2E family transporter [Patescibacteria group bacterium]
MPQPQERTVVIKTSTILKVIIILLALGFLWLIRDILMLLFVALFLAALMHPAARWGATKKIPKGLTVVFIYLILFALLAASFALIIPTLVRQLGSLSQIIGSSIVALSSSIQSLREFTVQYGLAGNLSAGVASLQEQASHAATGLFATLTGFFGGIVGFVIVLVMAFYMVVQDKEAVRMFYNLVPEKYQDLSARLLAQVETKIGRWLIGQLALSLIIGVAYYIGLLVLDVQGALALSIFAGFTEFIPYLGPILGGIPIVIVALSDSVVKALFALGLVVIIQQLENHVIVPRLMQKAVGLNPLISIVALLVGAQLFGIFGALLAIPIATALSVVLSELYKYKQGKE